MNDNYEDQLIREMTGEGNAPGDTNCSDCHQVICACESLADWHRERDKENSGEDVCLPASPEPTSFSTWLEKHNDHLRLPESFQEWLDQNEDSIIQ